MDGLEWNTLLKWMIWGENPLFLETPICVTCWFRPNQPLVQRFVKNQKPTLRPRPGQHLAKDTATENIVGAETSRILLLDVFFPGKGGGVKQIEAFAD